MYACFLFGPNGWVKECACVVFASFVMLQRIHASKISCVGDLMGTCGVISICFFGHAFDNMCIGYCTWMTEWAHVVLLSFASLRTRMHP